MKYLRYGIRSLAKSPGFCAAVVLTLALTIGANTAVFSIVEGILFSPLPYRDPGRLVAVWDRDVREHQTSKLFDSYADFRSVAAHARSFHQVAAATWAVPGRILSGRGPARKLLVIPVSSNFFDLLGVPAERGRTFAPSDTGCTLVASNTLWKGPLAGDPLAVGGHVRLDDRLCTVLGVMPAGFAFYPAQAQAWMLLTPDLKPDSLPLGIFARLKTGVSLAVAQGELTALHAHLHGNGDTEPHLEPVAYPLREEFQFLAESRLRTTLLALWGAVGLVLAIACVNVANLMLRRGVEREREMAVRAALGSGSGRLIREVLFESALLAFAGGVLGVALGAAAIALFRRMEPVEMPVGTHFGINPVVLAFTAGVSLAAALLFGILPALRAARVDIAGSLKSVRATRGVQRATRWMAGSQVALSLVLLCGAALLMRSVLKMGTESLGFHPEGLSAASIALPPDRYAQPEKRGEFFRRLEESLGGQAAFHTMLPPYGPGPTNRLQVEGRRANGREAPSDTGSETVDANYLRLARVSILRGRGFDWRDRSGRPAVALINESLAKRYFPLEDPIGRKVCLGDSPSPECWRTIVGVMADEKRAPAYHSIGWVSGPMLITPLAQNPPLAADVVLEGSAAQLSKAVPGIDPSVAVGDVELLETRLGRMMAYPRFRAGLLGGFAGLAILLAAIGLYGLLSQFVAMRSREIGVRMALGAQGSSVLGLVARQAGAPVLLGIGAGLAGSLGLTRYLESLLYGLNAMDPATMAGASLALGGIGVLAGLAPAARALNTDPAVVLRDE